MPTTSLNVNTGILESISGIRSVKNKNWATQSVNSLVQAVKVYKKKRTSYLGGCVLFLQVKV